MNYTCCTESDLKQMLETIGVSNLDKLFSDIPEGIRLKNKLNLPEPVSEIEAEKLLKQTAVKNSICLNFLGAGAYSHHIPAAVDYLSSRSEFLTAYTPYQPEASQGTLAAIFEFQTFICRLTGMDIANASLYDGATALAEAVLMTVRASDKQKIVVSTCVNPFYRDVLKTYSWANGIDITEVSLSSKGITPDDILADTITGDTSCVVIQNPNFFGSIEDIEKISSITKQKKCRLVVVISEPVSLGILKKPASLGADIVCGEAQSFGNPVGFGGPLLGIISAKNEFMRKMPGRLVGKTIDSEGQEAYALTLQTREQHIRRERATSNICTNQGHCALRAVIYLSLAGNRLRDIAGINHRLAGYMRKKLIEAGAAPMFSAPYFNEFSLRIDNAGNKIQHLKKQGLKIGVLLDDFYPELKDAVLICCTEKHSVQDIDRAVSIFKDFK